LSCLPRIINISVMICAAWVMSVGIGYGHGAYHDVVARLEARIKAGAGEPELRFELACAHQEHGEWELALVELERVERLAPGVHQTAVIQGMALATGRHWAHALAVLDDFLMATPGHAQALRQRGRVMRELGRREEAVRDLNEALKRETRPIGEQVTELCDLLITCGRESEAMVLLQSGRERLGDEPVLLEALLKVAERLERWDEALAAAEGLQQAAPRPEPWMVKRAELFESAGRQDEARRSWQALREHLMKLPSLERGAGQMAECLNRAKRALGESFSKPVAALPASAGPQLDPLQSAQKNP
jgi:tetratricopeptide (TPR) repeat protein